tara:strand:+ start:930 stop:1961 length:1032 start_codon:yes stop_codon:yes gene_type:complete
MLKTAQLGRNSGLLVSKLCLGTMNFGEPGRGHQGDWTLDAAQAEPIFKAAIDCGLNYFDCANVYGIGASEEVVGKLLNKLLPRDEYILTTKVSFPMGQKANQSGLSRKHIMESVDRSLQRLGHDYIDQLIIHRHPHSIPGSPATPLEETMEALNDVVKAGKALYLGASSMFSWQFVEMQMLAEQHGWRKFISMQNHYNLIYREEEREMIPYCLNSGVGVTPWSPLARGILAGAYKGSFDKGTTNRSSGQDRSRTESLYLSPVKFEIAARVETVAEKYGVKPAQIAIAWVLKHEAVSCAVVGVSKVEQLEGLVAATQLKLDAQDIDYLEELYQPVDNLLSLGTS